MYVWQYAAATVFARVRRQYPADETPYLAEALIHDHTGHRLWLACFHPFACSSCWALGGRSIHLPVLVHQVLRVILRECVQQSS